MSGIKSWAEILKLPKGEGKIWLIFGHRRMGKSGLGWWLAERLHKKYLSMKVVAVGLPKEKRKLLPKWVSHVDDIMRLPDDAIVVVDEAALRYSARRSQSNGNVLMMGLMALAGQRNQIIIFISHTARMLDVEQVFDSDLVLYKLPSAAHVKFERREIAEFTAKARKALLKMKNPKQWAYVIDFHSDRTGLLKNTLPSFWTKELSNAWAGLDISQLLTIGSKSIKGGKIL